MKKLIAIILALIMLLMLGACSSNNQTPATSTPSAESTANSVEPSASTNESESSTDTYVFSFASSFGAGSSFNTLIELPLAKLLEEKSGGRMKLEIYSGGVLGAQGTALDAVVNGTADMAYDMTSLYAGSYPYLELIDLPGWYLPGSVLGSELVAEYDAEFATDEFAEVKLLAHMSVGNMGVITTSPVRSVSDMKGLQIRASGPQIPWLASCGAVGVAMPSSEVYESIRLNVINGAILSTYAVTTFRLQEIAGYYTNFPMVSGFNIVIMNLDLYESMNDVDKAIIDDVANEFQVIAAEYGDICIEEALNELDTELEFIDLTDSEIEALNTLALPLIEEKVDELNAAGLRGTEAYNWLIEKTSQFR